ncbi:DUF6230 family protein [Spongisporangium articulatum]|uniref:DUF6230 family protein n=1 Tax=Spongisporangium articulatum TaxID=3362603 RepID=A0ABW8APQ7_9ACTN
MTVEKSAGRRKTATHWKRFGLIAVPAFVVSGAMLAATGTGAVAASFAIAGTNFKIHANKLHGEGMTQYGTVDKTVDGKSQAVAVNAFKKVELYSLCQSMVIPTPVKDITIKLTAGSDTDPVEATNMVTDLDLLQGDVVFNNPRIGIDASTSDRGPVSGDKGAFSLDATSVDINDVDIQAWATTAGTFKLKGLKMTAAFGKDECF